MVNTRFWEDNYTSNLDPIEKLLFLYFLTNTSTNICGIYEMQLRKVAVETGIDKEMVEKILKRFTNDNKIFYVDGWVGIKNFIKHQNHKSPQVQKGIERELEEIPENVKKMVLLSESDTISIPYTYPIAPNLTKPNLTKPNAKARFDILGAEVLKAFETIDAKNKTYYNNKTQRGACDFLLKEYGMEEIMKRISVLEKTNKLPYFPKITCPNDLKEKWVKLNDAVITKRTEKNEKKIKIIM